MPAKNEGGHSNYQPDPVVNPTGHDPAHPTTGTQPIKRGGKGAGDIGHGPN